MGLETGDWSTGKQFFLPKLDPEPIPLIPEKKKKGSPH